MFKKLIAGILGFTMIFSAGVYPEAVDVYAAEISEAVFTSGENDDYQPPAADIFSDGGVEMFTDAVVEPVTEPSVPGDATEAVVTAEEGADITAELNSLLLLMRDRATDEKPCKVIIPPGNYQITGTICMYSNIHLYAVGATITKTSQDKRMLLRLGNTEESAGGYDGYRNVTIEGGTWDINYDTIPNKEAAGGCTGFRLGHVTNVTIKDVTLLNNLKSHLIELAGVKNAKITGCTFRGYWEPYEGGAQECIQMDVCHESYFPNYKPSDRSVCENIYIEGNTFENAFAGVGCHSMSFNRPFRNIVIRNNTFRDIKKRAVWCTNSVDSVVENNSMINVGAGIYVRSLYSHCAYINEGQNATNADNQYPLNLVVRNNEIVLNRAEVISESLWKSYGIYLTGEKCVNAENNIPDGIYTIKGVTVADNKITGPGKGIQCILAEDCSITGNVMKLAGAEAYANTGITLGGSSSVVVQDNTVEGCTGHGIYAYSGSYGRQNRDNTISGNTVTACGNSGIVVKDSLSTSITGNKVSKSAREGIRTEGRNSRLSVKKNTVSKNKGEGILLGGGNNSVVAENTVAANGKNGISIVKSTPVTMYKNSIRSNKDYGIIGTDSDITTLKSNVLKGNGYTDTIFVINTSLPYNVKNRVINKVD